MTRTRMLRMLASAVTLMAFVAGPAHAQTGGRLVEERLDATTLHGSLVGDPSVRSIYVYLPPSYDRTPGRRYPVVYLLHAYGASPASWLGVDGYEGFHIGHALDSLMVAGAVQEMLVVMPDARNRFGGSWYANSPATGRWTDFIARELVSYMDRHYRTVADRGGRGIAGQSMGGYGALRVSMWYPDVFGAVLALSPVNLMVPNPFGEPGMEAALDVTDFRELDEASPVARVLLAKAAAFTPDPQAPPFYGRLPYYRRNGRLTEDPDVWATWWQSALVNRLDERREGLAAPALRLEVGRDDPLVDETRSFSLALEEAGVEHEVEEFDGGHVVGIRRRLETSVFQFFSTHLGTGSGTDRAAGATRLHGGQ